MCSTGRRGKYRLHLAHVFSILLFFSIVLEAFALSCYFAARRFKSQTKVFRRLFWLILGFGIVLTIVSWTPQPE